nr:unnamed protein product [Callosobruchus analis]
MFRILPLLAASYLPALPTEIWCLILRYLDDDGLLLAVRSNRSWLEYVKGDPVLNNRLNSVYEEKGRFLEDEDGRYCKATSACIRHKDIYEEMLTQKTKPKKNGGKVKSLKSNVRNKPYRL